MATIAGYFLLFMIVQSDVHAWLRDGCNPAGVTTYRDSFVTSLPVGPDCVVELAACGRVRCKLENETFDVLKNDGYNFEHGK